MSEDNPIFKEHLNNMDKEQHTISFADECSLVDTLTLELGDGTTITFTPHPEHGWYNEEHNIILKWDFNWWSHSVVNFVLPDMEESGFDYHRMHQEGRPVMKDHQTIVDLPTIIDKENDDG